MDGLDTTQEKICGFGSGKYTGREGEVPS